MLLLMRVSKGASIKFKWQIAQNVHEVILRGGRFSAKLRMSMEMESVVHVRHFATISILLIFKERRVECRLLDIKSDKVAIGYETKGS